MSLQEGFQNLKERFFRGKPSKKRIKLGEDEDDWCDALNHLSVESDSDVDEEYFDALEHVDAQEPQVTSKLLPTGQKRKKAQGQKMSTNKFEKTSKMNPFHTSSTSESRRKSEGKIKQRQRQSSPRHSNRGGYQFGQKDSSPSPLMETEPAGGSNTATSSSSETDLQVGYKRLTSIHDPPQEHPKKGYTCKGGISDSKLEKLAKDLMDEDYRNARLLGQKLGFNVKEFYEYCGYGKPKNSSGILRMLRAWKDKTPDAKQISGLLEALKKANMKHLADDLYSQEAPSTSTLKKTEPFQFGNGRSNTATSSFSESAFQVGSKQSATIHDPPQSQLPMKDYTDKGKLEKRKVTVTLMTSWQLSSIEGLKKKLMTLRRVRPDLIEAVKVLPLPFSGIQRYTFTEDVDIMVLCHSIVNRRFAITNVTDSLYDEFLNYCNKKLGKERIAVIAHDFPQEKDEVRAVRMNTFKHTQWLTFEKAGLVMMCGMMDKTPEIQEKDWNSLVTFLEDASNSTQTNDDISQTMLLKKDTSDTKQKPTKFVKDKKGSDICSKSLATSSGRSDRMVMRSRKPVFYICTSWGLDSVKGLNEKLRTLLKQSFSRYEIKEQELPYSSLEDFKFPSEVDRTDAMILCHSVQNRGFSITDVQNSIYDEFLRHCNGVFGKNHMAVIVHDFEDKPEILKIHFETFQRTQPTTFKLADFVALAGQLDVYDVKLCHDKSTSLETFVRKLR